MMILRGSHDFSTVYLKGRMAGKLLKISQKSPRGGASKMVFTSDVARELIIQFTHSCHLKILWAGDFQNMLGKNVRIIIASPPPPPPHFINLIMNPP